MKTVDRILFVIYALFFPVIIAINYLFLMLLENGIMDIELPFDGAIYFNVCFLITVIYLVGYFAQGIINGVVWIKDILKRKECKK